MREVSSLSREETIYQLCSIWLIAASLPCSLSSIALYSVELISWSIESTTATDTDRGGGEIAIGDEVNCDEKVNPITSGEARSRVRAETLGISFFLMRGGMRPARQQKASVLRSLSLRLEPHLENSAPLSRRTLHLLLTELTDLNSTSAMCCILLPSCLSRQSSASSSVV